MTSDKLRFLCEAPDLTERKHAHIRALLEIAYQLAVRNEQHARLWSADPEPAKSDTDGGRDPMKIGFEHLYREALRRVGELERQAQRVPDHDPDTAIDHLAPVLKNEFRHSFVASATSRLCAQCKGGRLHEIHLAGVYEGGVAVPAFRSALATVPAVREFSTDGYREVKIDQIIGPTAPAAESAITETSAQQKEETPRTEHLWSEGLIYQAQYCTRCSRKRTFADGTPCSQVPPEEMP